MTITTISAQVDYKDYIQEGKIVADRKGGRLNQSYIITYEDGTEWVFLNNKDEERFCGFLYLQKALKDSGLDDIVAAENRVALDGRDIIYLSKYCGEIRPNVFDYAEKILVLNNIGFKDTAGGLNLRILDGKLYVFDTEKFSFAESVHDKIDSFKDLNDAVRKSLKE